MKEIVLVAAVVMASFACAKILEGCRHPINEWNAHIANLNRLHYQEAVMRYKNQQPEKWISEDWLNPLSGGE